MNNGIELAIELAKIKLAYEWKDEIIANAFEGEGCGITFGEAMELFAPALGPSGLWLLRTFDRAGMSKEEMAEAIWRAAEQYYDSNLVNKEDEQ